MNDLLNSAVAAHGGLDRWNQVKSITVDDSIPGALWLLKSKGDALKDVRFEVDTTRELVTIDFAGHDKRSVFEPHRVVLQRRDGALIDAARPGATAGRHRHGRDHHLLTSRPGDALPDALGWRCGSAASSTMAHSLTGLSLVSTAWRAILASTRRSIS